MARGKLKVHSENILPIIKKWLYSDKDIFLRELISNSCDALFKIKVLKDKNEEIEDLAHRIDVIVDKEKKTITISDTGIGMTQEEVENYIAQVAFSGAKEFLEKYSTQNEKDQIIGHFGLGFFSSFMVSKKVDIQTLSYQKEASPVFWSSDGSSEYEIDTGTKTERGTSITLFIEDDSLEYLEEAHIRKILTNFCAYLPYPIYLKDEKINHKEPLWCKPQSECTEKEYLEFYRELYPMEPDPLFWVHFNVDYPFHLKGILYFPKIHKRFDFQNNLIKLFCNRVFVSDNCKDLLPDYLTVLRGAIDSPDIPLNVSRSYLQVDKTVRQLGNHISKKITSRLKTLFQEDREKYTQYWPDFEMILKMGVIQEESFFERVKDLLIWKTLKGEYKTIQEYLDQNSKTEGTIYYSSDEKADPDLMSLYQEKEIDVFFTHPMIDTHLIQNLETKLPSVHFKRIDSSLQDTLIDSSKEKTVLDSDGKSESAKIADFVRSSLNIKDLEVEAKSLASEKVPALFLFDEESRRLKDFMMSHSPSESLNMPQKKTFVVNTNNKLVLKAFALQSKQSTLSQDLVKQIYDLTLLSQKELAADQMTNVLSRNTKILEQLVALVPE